MRRKFLTNPDNAVPNKQVTSRDLFIRRMFEINLKFFIRIMTRSFVWASIVKRANN